MRYLAYLVLSLLISCSGKVDETGTDFFSDIEFSWDTVLIDPGDDIIFLRHQLLNSDLSKDRKYLYNYNEREGTVEKINLDELRLEDKLILDREGPNGTGGSAGIVQAHYDDQFTLDGMFQTSLFPLSGKKLISVYFENFSLGGTPMDGGEQVLPKRVLDLDGKRLYGLIQRYKTNTVVLGIMNLEDYEISKIELESFEKLPDYHFQYNLGNAVRITKKNPYYWNKGDTIESKYFTSSEDFNVKFKSGNKLNDGGYHLTFTTINGFLPFEYLFGIQIDDPGLYSIDENGVRKMISHRIIAFFYEDLSRLGIQDIVSIKDNEFLKIQYHIMKSLRVDEFRRLFSRRGH